MPTDIELALEQFMEWCFKEGFYWQGTPEEFLNQFRSRIFGVMVLTGVLDETEVTFGEDSPEKSE